MLIDYRLEESTKATAINETADAVAGTVKVPVILQLLMTSEVLILHHTAFKLKIEAKKE